MTTPSLPPPPASSPTPLPVPSDADGRTHTVAWLGLARTRTRTIHRRQADPTTLGGSTAAPAGLLRTLATWVLGLLVVLILAVAALAFVASFETISAFAVSIGWPDRLRWVPPMLVDTFTLVGTLLVLWLGLTGRNPWTCVAGYYGRLLVLAGTAASVIVNLDAHHTPTTGLGSAGATGDPAGATLLAVGPPAALFLAVEVLVIVARHVLDDLATPPAPAPAAAHPAKRPAVAGQTARTPPTAGPASLVGEVTDRLEPAAGSALGPAGQPVGQPAGRPIPATLVRTDRPGSIRDRVRDRLAAAVAAGRPDGKPWTNRTLADAVGCAPSTAGDYLREHRQTTATATAHGDGNPGHSGHPDGGDRS